MKKIVQTYHIKSSREEVWQALTNTKYIKSWGGGPAKMNDEKGFKFSLWGGSIWGENIEVLSHKKLVQNWYSNEDNKWDKPSIVTFNLSEEKDGIKLELVHQDVPDENYKDINEGWKDYYLGPLKKYLEQNSLD